MHTKKYKNLTRATLILCVLIVLLVPSIERTWLTKDTASPSVSGHTHSYTIPVLKNGSVYEAMNLFASSSSFSFRGKKHPHFGFFIEEIEGTRNANGVYWTLYVNGAYSENGASSHMVGPGDNVEWKFIKL